MADEYWFPWYPGHYERDAGHLDHVADSCYRRLIDFYMRGGEPIPRDPVRLMHVTRTTPQQFQTVWPQIEGFFTEIDGLLHLKRCNIELDRQDTRRRFASEAGKRSAEKRKQQFQLLLNDRSTTVQPMFNDGSTSRATTGEDRTEHNINISLDAAREPVVDKSGEQVNKLNGDSSHASRASLKKFNGHNGHSNGTKYTPEQKRDAWIQKVCNYLNRTLPEPQATEIIFGYSEGDRHFVKKFEEASERMNAEKAAGARR